MSNTQNSLSSSFPLASLVGAYLPIDPEVSTIITISIGGLNVPLVYSGVLILTEIIVLS